jgi:hypothetical protein
VSALAEFQLNLENIAFFPDSEAFSTLFVEMP